MPAEPGTAEVTSSPRDTAAESPLPKPSTGCHGKTARIELIASVLAVLGCAVLLRLVFVEEVILQNSFLYPDLTEAPKAGFLTADSNAYIHLAKDFWGGYWGDRAGNDALLRPPGYPAFCVPFYTLGLAPSGILIIQAFLSALIPLLTWLLARIITGSVLISGFAGLLSAISPSGIGLCGLIMSDVLLAVMFMAGLFLLYLAVLRNRTGYVLTAGVAFSYGFLIKPILVFWPAVMIPVYWLLCRGERKQPNWRAVALAVAIQVATIGLWCARNYAYDGIFTPSRVGTDNLHNFMRPRVEEWVKNGGLPQAQVVADNRKEALAAISQQMAGISAREELNLLAGRSLAVFRAHPLVTIQVLFQNASENAISGWDYFQQQLPLGASAVKKLNEIARKESFLRQGFLIVAGVFYCSLLISIWAWPSVTTRRWFALTTAFLLVYIYFAVVSGTTYWTGSRIMYPVEFVMILLVMLTLQAGVAGGKEMLTHGRLRPYASLPIPDPVRRCGPWLMVLLVLGAGIYGTHVLTEEDTETFCNFGAVLAARGNIREAIPFFERALQLSTENLKAKFNLALAYTDLKRTGEAIPLLREILRTHPMDVDAHYLLGMILAGSGRGREGSLHLLEALRLNPNLEEARKALKELMNQNETQPTDQRVP